MKNYHTLFTKFFLLLLLNIFFVFLSISKVSAYTVMSPYYGEDIPSSYVLAPASEQWICGTWRSPCWNSQQTGVTNCGDACSGGEAWSKYEYSGCYLYLLYADYYVPVYTEPSQSYVCSTGDKYNSSNTPVMNSGNCNCSVGGAYKTCCLGTTPVSARNICSIGSPLCDYYDPPEADCGGNTEVRCGGPGEPACGQAACNTLYTPPPQTCDQSCTSWTNSNCGNGSNGCSVGQRKQTRNCPAGSCSTSRCVTDSSCDQSCTPFSQGPVCDTGWCPDESVCAQGHKYCLWDGSGYGDCSEEVNNCSTQCSAPPSTPPPGNCSFSSCGANGCGSDQRYVSGDKCYSDYSWYVGAGCYHDGSCSGGGSSSVSCSATTPVMRGTPTTISVTQQPNNGGEVSCYYNRIDANVYLGSTSKGSCAATGFDPDHQTRTCKYTPTEAGNYSVGVYYGGHSDPSYWDCWPTGPGGSWDSYECRWVQGCEDPQAWGNCNFTSIAMTPCPGGTNACGSSTYQGLSGCSGYWSYPNNTEYNRWCSANAGTSRPNCYSCNPWGSPPTIISATCTRDATGNLNTASLFWNRITGADPYISSQSPLYGYYNIIYGTSCNPSNPSTCQTANNIYAANKTLNNLEFGEYTWAVQGCNAVTNTCSGWSSPAGSFNCNVSAWIQTTGGDVHSNVRINAPGGP